MFHKFSEKLIAYAVKNHDLDKDAEEEYVYGLEITLSVMLSYLSVVIIGSCMGMLWQTIIYLFLYAVIRRFAGGFHFSSQMICLIFTCVISTVILIIIKYVDYDPAAFSLITLISALVLALVSPVPAVEKPLDEKEKTVYGKISRMIVAAVAVMYVALSLFQCIYTAKIIAVTVCTAAVFAVLGKLKYIAKMQSET